MVQEQRGDAHRRADDVLRDELIRVYLEKINKQQIQIVRLQEQVRQLTRRIVNLDAA